MLFGGYVRTIQDPMKQVCRANRGAWMLVRLTWTAKVALHPKLKEMWAIVLKSGSSYYNCAYDQPTCNWRNLYMASWWEYTSGYKPMQLQV